MTKVLKFNPEWQKELINKYEKLEETAKLLIIKDKSIQNDGSDIYVRNKMNFAKSLPNVKAEVLEIDGTDEKELTSLVPTLQQKWFRGYKIMLQKPCSKELDNLFKDFIGEYYTADVEGVSKVNELALLQYPEKVSLNDNFILPCTVLGNLILLNEVTQGDHDYYDGKTVLIIGRSEIVGKPLAQVFEKEDCTTILANSHSQNLQNVCRMSDVIISCVEKPNLVQDCKQGAVLIDNGCTLVNGKQHGDISKNCWEKSSAYTPYVGATGKATVFSLFANLLKLQF